MITSDISAGWRPATIEQIDDVSAGWSPTLPSDAGPPELFWGTASARNMASVSAWDEMGNLDPALSAPWDGVGQKEQGTDALWGDLTPIDGTKPVRFHRTSQARDQLRLRLRWNPKPAQKDMNNGQVFQRCDEFRERYDVAQELKNSLYVPNLVSFNFSGDRYTPNTTPIVFFQFRYVRPVRAIQPVETRTQDGWGSAGKFDMRSTLRWGPGRPKDPEDVDISYPDYPGPIHIIPAEEPEILETYMIANSVSLVVLPDRTPLQATAMSVSRDIDSFVWQFTAQIAGRTSLNLVRPDSNGPKTVELSVNGHVWHFLIERYSGVGKFPSEHFSLTGVSRVQLLAEPYAPKRSAVNTYDINARQVAEDQLLYTGFTLNWNAVDVGPPDWTIPAGAFTFQDLTPMQIIARVAEAVGAVIKPGAASDEITVLPRYRDAPWNWGTSLMEKIIPAQVVGEWGSEWSPNPEWNVCYVSGTSHGVAVDVRRAGTAGDEPAPDVLDDLVTSTDMARHRGIVELAKGGNQEIVTLHLPLFPLGQDPGLIEPAMLCEVRELDGTWRGLNLSTEIALDGVGATRVKQTIRLERHH